LQARPHLDQNYALRYLPQMLKNIAIIFIGIWTTHLLAAEPNTLESLNAFGAQLLGPESEAQQYVDELLEEKFELDWKLSSDNPLDQFSTTLAKERYSIKFPKKCNPWTENYLSQTRYRKKLLTQIQNATDFLAEYHYRMLGNNRSLFGIRRIVICTNSRYHKKPLLAFDRLKHELTLRIGPKRLTGLEVAHLRRNNLNPLSSEEMITLWNSGEQWKKDRLIKNIIDRKKNPIRGYWEFINPIGEVRVTLREILRKISLQSYASLKSLRDIKSIRTHLLRNISQPENLNLVEKASGAVIEKAFSEWLTKLAKAGTSEELAAANLIACLNKKAQQQKDADISVTQTGLINVENFHQIDVNFTVGDIKAYQEFVTVPDKLKINVTQRGLVNVSTADDIDVSVVFGGLMSPVNLRKATLSSVLKNLR